MELIDGIICLDEDEHETLYLIAEDTFPENEPPKYPVDHFRRVLEQMRDMGSEKHDELMGRWNDVEQKTAAKAGQMTKEMFQFITCQLFVGISTDFLNELDQITRPVH